MEKIIVGALLVLLCTSCGVKGPPLPPLTEQEELAQKKQQEAQQQKDSAKKPANGQ